MTRTRLAALFISPLMATMALEGTEAMLDIGFGDGKIMVELANRVPPARVVGFNCSSTMVELTKAS